MMSLHLFPEEEKESQEFFEELETEDKVEVLVLVRHALGGVFHEEGDEEHENTLSNLEGES